MKVLCSTAAPINTAPIPRSAKSPARSRKSGIETEILGMAIRRFAAASMRRLRRRWQTGFLEDDLVNTADKMRSCDGLVVGSRCSLTRWRARHHLF